MSLELKVAQQRRMYLVGWTEEARDAALQIRRLRNRGHAHHHNRAHVHPFDPGRERLAEPRGKIADHAEYRHSDLIASGDPEKAAIAIDVHGRELTLQEQEAALKTLSSKKSNAAIDILYRAKLWHEANPVRNYPADVERRHGRLLARALDAARRTA